jgi:hypothetical protein
MQMHDKQIKGAEMEMQKQNIENALRDMFVSNNFNINAYDAKIEGI